jgi:hypothetical protein
VTGPLTPIGVLPLAGGRVAFSAAPLDATGLVSYPSILVLAGHAVRPVLVDGESTSQGVVDLSGPLDFTTLGRSLVVTGSVPGTRSALLARRPK